MPTLSTLTTRPTRILGCDVGKSEIVIFDTACGTCQSVPNRKPDLMRLARRLGQDCLVVCEATGGYEAKLLAVVLSLGVPTHRGDARKIKSFIRSFGTLGKSDLANRMPSTPKRSPAMALSAGTSLFYGNNPIPFAKNCKRLFGYASILSGSGRRTSIGSPRPSPGTLRRCSKP